MMRYKLLLFLILLPLLTKSKNVRPKRPRLLDQNTNTQFPLIDQIALADTWKSPSRVISATYSGDPETGHVNHANLVINLVPRTNKKPAEVDLIASQSLANAKTAEEYVSKALELKHKYDHSTPSSSFVKYDIYEPEKKKQVPVTPIPSRIEEPIDSKDDEQVHDLAKSSSDFNEYYHRPDYTIRTTTTTRYNNPDETLHTYNYKDLDSSNTDYNNQFTANYDSFGTINNINYDNQKSFTSALQKMTGYPTKEEVFDYIEKAVKKYMRELESEGKLSGGSSLTGMPSAHAEIKTYYRFPSTTMSPITSTKMYAAGTHSEFFKPSKGGHLQVSYSTVKPFIVESYTPDGIDLTFRNKKRPKPIDLSAIDVGQSWSHNAGSETVPSYRKPHKTKLKFNSQTYHDINALTYVPNRGLIYEGNNPYSTSTSYPDLANSHSSVNLKDHPVGASISFGGSTHESEDSSKSSSSHFTPSMQVLNGVPVTNPYKFNMETLNDIFENGGERVKDTQISDPEYSISNSWNPYSMEISSIKESDNSSPYQFDTYNPKYNNNPEGHGYQDNYKYSLPSDWDTPTEYVHRQRGTIGSDMYSSASSHKPKKLASSSHYGFHGKRAPTKPKNKIKHRNSKRMSSQHNRDLERDLTPPPAKF